MKKTKTTTQDKKKSAYLKTLSRLERRKHDTIEFYLNDKRFRQYIKQLHKEGNGSKAIDLIAFIWMAS